MKVFNIILFTVVLAVLILVGYKWVPIAMDLASERPVMMSSNMNQLDLKILAFILKHEVFSDVTVDMTEMTIKKLPDGNAAKGSTFSDCNALTKVILPDSLLAIGSYSFSYCQYLESVTVSSNLTSIGDNAFDGCNSLKSISYDGTKKQWTSVLMKTGEGNDVLLKTLVVCSDGIYSVWNILDFFSQ